MPDVYIYLFIMDLFSGAASVTKNSKPAAVVCVSCYLRVSGVIVKFQQNHV